jgi:hypothetical protein
MHGLRPILFTLTLGFCLVATAEVAPAAASSKPVKAENFRLLDHRGESHELYRYRDHKAVVLYVQGNGCPIARQSYPEIKRIRRAYKDKGVAFFLLNANPQDTREEVDEELRDFRVNISTLMDSTQTVARSLGLERTCEALVLRPSDWAIVYRGPVDDRFDYGAQKPEATQQYLRTALDQLLAGEPVTVEQHATKGCKINVLDPPKVDYLDVAPILEQKCVPCHRDGGAGPFAMKSFDKVNGWASMIRETIMTGTMPPWHADPHVGEFKNDRGLRDDEKSKLIAWVEAGAPRGDESSDPLAALELPPLGMWKLGEPDLVLSMPEPYKIPAEGVLEYAMITVPTNLEQDVWVRGIEVIPGATEAVHHVLIFIQYPEHLKQYEPDADGGAGGFFGGFVPGAEPFFFPEGTGKYIPAGASFLFQMHYVTTGKPHEDITRMGLYLHKEPPAEQLETIGISYGDFAIKPGERVHRVSEDGYFSHDMKLWAFAPHMHYRGARMSYTAIQPDGNRIKLCSVPDYRFDWQTVYQLKEPFPISRGTRILVEGAFDNSATNPYNPDPTQTVHFGDQTYDEMFIGYMDISARPEVFHQIAEAKNTGREQRLERFKQQHPEYLREAPYTAEELEGSYWQGGDWKFRFNPEGVILVNGIIKGQWKIENNRVVIDVVGSHFELDIVGKHLVSHGNYEIQRLE